MNITFLLDSYKAYSETFIHNQIDFFKENHNIKVFPRKLVNQYPFADEKVFRVPTTFRQKINSYIAFKTTDIFFIHYLTNEDRVKWIRSNTSAPICLMAHGYDLLLAEAGRIDIKFLNENVNFLFAISDLNRNRLKKLGFDENKIINHPVGIEIKNFKKKHTQQNVINLVSIGRLEDVKNHELALEVVAHIIKNKKLKLTYTIIGDGAKKVILEQKIKNLGIENETKLLGYIPNQEIHSYLLSADIYLQTSKSEVLPLSIMEAGAIGLPVVSTNVGSISEIISDNNSGFLVDTQEEIINKLVLLINDNKLRETFGAYSRNYIINKFDISELNRKLEEILVKIVSNNKVKLK